MAQTLTDDETTSKPEKLDPEDSKAISQVLSFYGSQVTSHAGLTVGLSVAFLTMFQVRFSTQFPDSLRPVLLILVFTVTLAGIYSGLRIVLYGKLSGVLMHSGLKGYRKALAAHEDSSDWPPLTKATMFSEYHLKNDTLRNKPFLQLCLMDMRTRFLVSATAAFLIVLSLAISGV